MFDLKSIDGTSWLIEPTQLRLLVLRVSAHQGCYTAREVAKERRKALEEARRAPELAIPSTGVSDPAELEMAAGPAVKAVKGKVGVINVRGPIQQKHSSELMKSGGTSTEAVGVALDAMLNDHAIDAIVLRVDSPGGGSYGVQELGDEIFNARKRKPIYAHADSMMASAAFWLGTSAGMVLATPGADLGSVGVYTIHVDESKKLESEGVTVSMIKAGKYKAELAPISPLTEESRAYLQESVNDTYAQFAGALKRNRGVSAKHVEDKFGQGRIVSAQQAVERGMADRVMTFKELMQKLTGTAGNSQSGQRASGVPSKALRMRQADRKDESVA